MDEADTEQRLSRVKTPSPQLCDWKSNSNEEELYTFVCGSGYGIDIKGKYVITDANKELIEKYVEQTSTEAVSEE